ncbi:methylated-DNA--[protein]-cysteine S-methyltransferase [Pseudogracilibacillus sp. ICA-222130]|uniref:methylated-DNA--[protein]-cysteine S-methyltransferase n=1 Tax=Pseudogracilibacillus sp. ICA-222130 TaxID=3134655 RepID=UPI0030C29340
MTKKVIYYNERTFNGITLYIAATEKGLKYIKRSFEKIKTNHPHDLLRKDAAFLAPYEKQLEQYFHGKRKTFDMPLDLEGTNFQMQVWNALQTIPYGETVSYYDIAKQIHHEKAVRAVGGANGKNPISIVIPCHRVVQKNGKLGGYSSGLDMKEMLLSLELRYK